MEPNEEHKVIKARNKGGLCYLKNDCIELFKVAEFFSQLITRDFVNKINYKAMVYIHFTKRLDNKTTLEKLIDDSEISIENHVGKDLLERVIDLSMRMRSFS